MYQALKNTLLISANIAVLFLVIALYRTSLLVTSLRETVASTQSDIHGSVQNLNAVLIQLGLASDEARRAATEQRSYWSQSSQQMILLLKNTNKTVQDVDAAALGLNQTNLHLQADLDTVAKSTSMALDSVPQTMESTQKTLDSATKLLSDPALTSTLKHIDGTTSSLEKTTARIDKKVEDLTKPASLFKTLIGKLFNLAVGVRQIIK